METIYEIIHRTNEVSNGVVDDSWDWFNGLNREEWIVVLAIGASLGFVCLWLGLGNKK